MSNIERNHAIAFHSNLVAESRINNIEEALKIPLFKSKLNSDNKLVITLKSELEGINKIEDDREKVKVIIPFLEKLNKIEMDLFNMKLNIRGGTRKTKSSHRKSKSSQRKTKSKTRKSRR